MTEAAAHAERARRFAAAYESLPPKHVELRLVALTYCAVNLVHAVRAARGLSNRKVQHRQVRIWLNATAPDVAASYWQLFQASLVARYDPFSPLPNGAEVWRRFEPLLEEVMAWAAHELA